MSGKKIAETASALPFKKETVIGKFVQYDPAGPAQLSVTLPVKPLACWSCSVKAPNVPTRTVSLGGVGVMVNAAITVRLSETAGAAA